MDSEWSVYVEDNDNNIPNRREQVLIRPGSINLFITICDYDEENYDDDDDEKDT